MPSFYNEDEFDGGYDDGANDSMFEHDHERDEEEGDDFYDDEYNADLMLERQEMEDFEQADEYFHMEDQHLDGMYEE